MINYMMAIRKDGSVVKMGDELTDFRGEKWIFDCVSTPSRVLVTSPDEHKTRREFYPSVFNLELKEI